MKILSRYVVLLMVLSSNAHAIMGGQIAGIDEYQSVGSVIAIDAALNTARLGSFVALSSTWVLTAAYVVDSPGGALLIGGHQDAPAGEPFFFIERIILHPNYMVGESHDDLALIKLSDFDPIVPSAHNMSFATLSNVALPTGIPTTATITGWGKIRSMAQWQMTFNLRDVIPRSIRISIL
jgi:hypothetical protein